MSLNTDNLPETSDEGTGDVESNHSKPYHKNVAGMLMTLMSDGVERRTGEIVAEIDASAVKVKMGLKKLEKTGELIKVRHGVYVIPITSIAVDPQTADFLSLTLDVWVAAGKISTADGYREIIKKFTQNGTLEQCEDGRYRIIKYEQNAT